MWWIYLLVALAVLTSGIFLGFGLAGLLMAGKQADAVQEQGLIEALERWLGPEPANGEGGAA